MDVSQAKWEIEGELIAAQEEHGPMASPHEGLAVIWEEFEELKAEVFRPSTERNVEAMRHEAMQVAAMGLRFMVDLT